MHCPLARPNSFEAQTRHKQVLLRKSRQPKSEFAPYFPPFNLCTPSQVLFTLGSCHKSSCIKLLLFLQGSTNNERSKETKCPQNSWAIHVDRPRRSTSAYRRLISRARLEAPYAIFRPRRSTRYILVLLQGLAVCIPPVPMLLVLQWILLLDKLTYLVSY